MPKSISRAFARSASVCALVCSAALLISTPTFADERKGDFNIPAENTAKALNDFSSQSGIQILFPYDAAATTIAPAVKGSYSAHDALTQLLANSNLEVAGQKGNVITLRAAKNDAPTAVVEPTTEVVVTGTRIRGSNPTSPIHTVSRKDIEASGFSQVGDVIRSLPENFAGGQNPGIIGASRSNATNINVTNASTINLRGLGSDATLVLVNGHRLSADYVFQGSDISGIPLGAVQRIEVVPDGASALYGSDAVAGVANIILRKNYDGTELTAHFGGATQGGGFDQSYNLLMGRSGSSGYILANLEYEDQDPVTAGEREFANGVPPATTLWAGQTRRSAFISSGLDINDAVFVAVDALWSERHMTSVVQSTGADEGDYFYNYTPAYNLNATVDIALAKSWKMHISGGLAGSRNAVNDYYYGYNYNSAYANDLTYAEFTADGTLLSLPGGPLKVALGGGVRHEGYRNGFEGEDGTTVASRQVTYAYAEALVPLISPSAERPGLNELELNLSTRAEHYSDFGDTTNPKVGLRYTPFSDLTLRASWGKSFKAPSFLQLYQDYGLTLYKAKNLGTSTAPATATALLVFGGNKGLKPEKSTSWTIGADYKPKRVPGLTLSATYFDVDYTDRVVQPINPRSTALSNPQYAPFVSLSPTTAELDGLFAKADYFNNFAQAPYDPANLVAVAYDNYQNATGQTAQGVDLSYRQTFDVWGGEVGAFANATWLKLRQQTIITQPIVELSGTIYNAPDFKARGGLTWERRNLTASAIVNFINSETDTGIIPNQDIATWSTVDATLSYRFAAATGLAKGTRISLAATNLFDRDPPRAASPALVYEGLAFDSTNTSLLGRFVSLTLSKAW